MAEFPALPLWTDAYLADTTHLTTLEHGAYLLLLMAMWRSKDCRLPADDRALSRYARVTTGQWARVKATLMAFFRLEDGHITQGRLTDEAVAVRQNSRRQSDKAKHRWLKNNETPDAVAMPNACRTDASLTLTLTTIESPYGDSPLPPRNDVGKIDGDFVAWWAAYPAGRKSAKPKCLVTYRRIVKSGRATPAELLAGAMRYAAAGYEGSQFVKGPLVWLNQGCWTDEDVPPPGDKPNGTPRNGDSKSREQSSYEDAMSSVRAGIIEGLSLFGDVESGGHPAEQNNDGDD